MAAAIAVAASLCANAAVAFAGPEASPQGQAAEQRRDQARAQPPVQQLALPDMHRLLVLRTLEREAVAVESLSHEGVVYRDRFGRRFERPNAEVLALLPIGVSGAGEAPPPPALPGGGRGAVIELTDGQRLLGGFRLQEAPGAVAEERMGVLIPLVGELEIPLERIRRVTLADPSGEAAAGVNGPGAGSGVGPGGGAAGGSATPAQPLSDDAVALVNGDELRGFIESIALGPDGVPAIAIDTGDRTVRVPLDRVLGFTFANPVEDPGGTLLYLDDGSVLAASRIVPPAEPQLAGLLRVTPATLGTRRPVLIERSRLRGVRFEGAGGVKPLTECAIERATPIAGRRWSLPPRVDSGRFAPLGAGDITLPGAMELALALPPSGTMFSASARLDSGIRGTPGIWADCVVVVEIEAAGERTPLARVALSADTPEADIRVELPAGSGTLRSLIIRVEPAAHGSVQDQVVIERGLIG